MLGSVYMVLLRKCLMLSNLLFHPAVQVLHNVVAVQNSFGFKKSAGGFQVKTEFNYTDWDTLSLTNTGTDAGSNKITVAPEQWSGKLTIGYNF